MDIVKLLPNLDRLKSHHDTDEEPSREQIEADAKKFRKDTAPKRGPGTGPVFMSNGRIRRQMVRDAKTKARKTNERHRRNWMKQRDEAATLVAQKNVLDHPENYPAEMVIGVERAVVAKYGDEYLEAREEQDATE